MLLLFAYAINRYSHDVAHFKYPFFQQQILSTNVFPMHPKRLKYKSFAKKLQKCIKACYGLKSDSEISESLFDFKSKLIKKTLKGFK